MRQHGLAVLVATLVALPATAQDAAPGRFQLEKTETGIVRLDTQSGTLTLCHEKEGNLVCRMAADERAAYEEELERLGKRVEALENATANRETAEKDTQQGLPGEAEIDRSFAIMEKIMRRFMGLAEELNKEPRHEAFPNKT